MKEYLVEIKVKNNLLYKAIMKRGYTSVGQFCRKNNLYASFGDEMLLSVEDWLKLLNPCESHVIGKGLVCVWW